MLNIKYDDLLNIYEIYNSNKINLGNIEKLITEDSDDWCFYPNTDTEFNKEAMKEILKCLEDPAKYMENNKNE